MIPFNSLDDLFKMKALDKPSKEEDDIWDVQVGHTFSSQVAKGRKLNDFFK
jgi:hypothetical protein